MKRSCYSTLLLVLAISLAQTALAQNILRPYPFKMPTRDTTKSLFLPNQSDEIAGSHGALSLSSEGHIVAADNTRLRFFGTTLWNNAQFLTSTDAKALAKRLKKLGFNAVHFAFNDYYNNDDASFFKYRDSANQLNKSSYIVNPLQLAKFDTLFSELKNNGVYTMMTTMSSHKYIAGDDVMYADSTYTNGYLMPFLDPQRRGLSANGYEHFFLIAIRLRQRPMRATPHWRCLNTTTKRVYIITGIVSIA